MRLLKVPTTLEKNLSLDFPINKKGWYLLSVSARVKSKKQREKGATDDEDLRVEIDGRKFPKLNNPQRYLDSPAAFSGADLNNHPQTVIFFINLDSGNHTLSLVSDEGALVENAEVSPLEGFPNVHLEINQQAERANGRPWLIFALVNLDLKSFTAKAIVNWHLWDGDDLKIIVDGTVKKNALSFFHRNWIFSADPLRKILGEEKPEEKSFQENLPPRNLHYLEFWSDESPTLYFAEFELLPPGQEESKIQTYRKGADGRDYNRLDTEIMKTVGRWNSFFLAQRHPPSAPLDPNLVKAIIYIESRMGYGVSATGHPSYPDVMQVGNPEDPAIHVLNNDGTLPTEFEAWSGKVEPLNYRGQTWVRSSFESVNWGSRWLYHKAQGVGEGGKQIWYSWKEAIKRYGPGTADYFNKVWELYETGKDPDGGENLF